MKIVATNVDASRPPKHQPPKMPTVCANGSKRSLSTKSRIAVKDGLKDSCQC